MEDQDYKTINVEHSKSRVRMVQSHITLTNAKPIK